MKAKSNQLKIIKEALFQSGRLIKHPSEFDKVFETIFQNFCDRKGNIDIHGYEIFLECLFAAIHKTIEFDYVLRKFDYADLNKRGNIDKEEFRIEVMKRLKEYYYYKSFY